jgi:hypothetical protein
MVCPSLSTARTEPVRRAAGDAVGHLRPARNRSAKRSPGLSLDIAGHDGDTVRADYIPPTSLRSARSMT